MIRRFLCWLRAKHHARLRQIDLDILWPACKRAANNDLTFARMAFAAHVRMDHAWDNISPAEFVQIITSLQ